MGYGIKRRTRRPTLRGLQKYIRKVDLRDRPPIKAVLDAAESILVPLNFIDTILLHKHSGLNTDGILATPIVVDNAQTKTLVNETHDGEALPVINENGVVNSILQNNPQAISILECWRPLLYEPKAYLKAMTDDFINTQGARKNRQVATCIVSGSFRIRLIEGINNPDWWAGGIKMIEHSGDPRGEVNYGKDGFASMQYVRCILVKVTDMGSGYGLTLPSKGTTLQDSSNPNFRYDDAAGVGQGAADTLNSHLLAPSLGDIFDNVGKDPDNEYAVTDVDPQEDFVNEDMIHWKYKKNMPANATPKHGENPSEASTAFTDPLRGSFRNRKFHVVIDKKIAFLPRGSQSERVNQDGARQHDFRWSVKIKNLRCQADNQYGNNDSVNRTREQLSIRLIWYFIPSISNFRNGVPGAGQVIGSGHHALTVSRGPEKCFWTEKDDA